MLRKKLKMEPLFDENTNNQIDQIIYPVPHVPHTDFATKYLAIEQELSLELEHWLKNTDLKKWNIYYVYQPLIYASEPHELFVRKYCNAPKKILFLGINPGPFGMSQTGVPFGEVNITKSWLDINGNVQKPQSECPKRPIEGFSFARPEPSGKKFWGLFKELCGTPQKFFANSFVYNNCPLTFMDVEGKNILPTAIKVHIFL